MHGPHGRKPSAPLVLSTIALFISLGGAGYAASGDNFILGQPNSATSQTSLNAPIAGNALRVVNTNTAAGATALSLSVADGQPPLRVDSDQKVPNLNADRFDNLDSNAFLRRGLAQTSNVTAAGGVLDVLNTGTTNGVQGRTDSLSASGVFGQNMSGGGFGVAGRAGSSGHAIYGDNTGSGFAGFFEDKVHIGGELDCAGCVAGADIAGKVDDSDKLDGIDSTGFVQGGGRAVAQALAQAPGTHIFLGNPMAGFIRLSYACPSTLTDNGLFSFYNNSGSAANVFVENGGANPTYFQMANNEQQTIGASATGDSITIQAQGAPGVQTIHAATVHRASDCHSQAQALLAN